MTPLARLRAFGLVLAGAIFAVDQAVKTYLMQVVVLPAVDAIEILPFFDLRFTRNYGVSMGLLAADSDLARWLLTVGPESVTAVEKRWR